MCPKRIRVVCGRLAHSHCDVLRVKHLLGFTKWSFLGEFDMAIIMVLFLPFHRYNPRRYPRKKGATYISTGI